MNTKSEEINVYKKAPAENRCYGIDLLRILSMVYVLILHTLGLGGILASVNPGTRQYSVFWFIEIWAYCAVNIFVMISGYTGYRNDEHRTDWSRLIVLWLEVVFYSVIVAVIYRSIHPDSVSLKTVRDMFFPLTNNTYWFFSSYAGLFLIRPFLDKAVRHTEKKPLIRLMAVIFAAFCCFPMLTDPFQMAGGYSFIWFVILYLIGAFLKKCEITEKISGRKALAGILMMTVFAWLWKMFGFEIRIMNSNIHPGTLISYISPVTVMSAALHVILFAKIRIQDPIRKIVTFFAPGAFAAYLINTHPCLWLTEFENRFTGWAKLRTAEGFFRIITYAVVFVMLSLLADKIRQVLFDRLKIKKSLQQILFGPKRTEAAGKMTGALFVLFFAGIWAFLFWKCPYGYGNIDETLYLTVPYRLLKWHDGLLVHEWHEFQLSTFPMLPVTFIYNLLFPGTERIILNFRLIYTFFWGCSALFLYSRTKRYTKAGAAAASLCYLIYAPYGIMAFSYNSMGIMFLLNACVLGMTARNHREFQYMLAGFFLAGAILCCPFLLVLYALLTIIALTAFIRKQDAQVKTLWLYATAGAFILFVIFCTFLLSRASLRDLIRSVPIVLDDVEHPDRDLSLLSQTSRYLSSLWHAAPIAPYVIIGTLLFCIIGRFRKQFLRFFFSGACLLTSIWLLYVAVNRQHINYLMLPVCFLGLFCRVNSENTTIKTLFRWLWIPGMIYTYCLNWSSNQGLYAITNAAAAAAFASFMIAVVFIMTEFYDQGMKRVLPVLSLILLITVQIGCELSLRYQNVFWETGIEEQKVYARTGPEKDILMTRNHLDIYERVLAELEPIRNDRDIVRILFFTNDPLLYLYTEKGIGSFSSWLPGINQRTIDRLDLYYEINPEKMPDAIFIPAENEKYLPHFEQMGYSTGRTSEGNYLLDRKEKE